MSGKWVRIWKQSVTVHAKVCLHSPEGNLETD